MQSSVITPRFVEPFQTLTPVRLRFILFYMRDAQEQRGVDGSLIVNIKPGVGQELQL